MKLNYSLTPKILDLGIPKSDEIPHISKVYQNFKLLQIKMFNFAS